MPSCRLLPILVFAHVCEGLHEGATPLISLRSRPLGSDVRLHIHIDADLLHRKHRPGPALYRGANGAVSGMGPSRISTRFRTMSFSAT